MANNNMATSSCGGVLSLIQNEHLGKILQAALRLFQGGFRLNELRIAVLQVLLMRQQICIHMRHILRRTGP